MPISALSLPLCLVNVIILLLTYLFDYYNLNGKYHIKIDELLKDDNISLEEIKYISDKLETKVNEIEELTKITANTISEVTHYTTVSIGPKADTQIIQEIKFVLLGSRMMLAVILTDTGLVKETIIK